jgi:hypothetical protein
MRKWCLITVGVFFLSAPLALAAGEFVPLAPISGLNEGVSATHTGISAFLDNLYTFCIGIAVVLAIIMIIWGGFEYALSEAISSKSAGKQKMVGAVFGLVLVLSPYVVFSIINPSILSLDVNMPALKTTWGNWAPGPTPDPRRPTTDIEAGKDKCYKSPDGVFSCYTTLAECRSKRIEALPGFGDRAAQVGICQQQY